MKKPFISKGILSVVVLGGVVCSLIAAAAKETKHEITTVRSLLEEGTPRSHLRLGGRVASADISYELTPQLRLQFYVTDPAPAAESATQNGGVSVMEAQEIDLTAAGVIPVVYENVKPDTFKVGRDVLLEGNFDGKVFRAESLQTQCPSKYEPPLPGEAQQGGGVSGDEGAGYQQNAEYVQPQANIAEDNIRKTITQ